MGAAAALTPMMMATMIPGLMNMGGAAGAPGSSDQTVGAAEARNAAKQANAAPLTDEEKEKENTKLLVGNLPNDIDKESMHSVFSAYGNVRAIALLQSKKMDPETGAVGQASAFVVYDNEYEAKTAINTLHERYEIRPGEGPITVKVAIPKRPPQQLKMPKKIKSQVLTKRANSLMSF